MTDKEMQMLAAQAAGLKVKAWWEKYPGEWWADLDCERQPNDPPTVWSSLHDDGDAIRLSAKLKIDLEWQNVGVFPTPDVEAYRRNEEGSCYCASEHENDYRRAITRAAAALAVSDLAKMEGAP